MTPPLIQLFTQTYEDVPRVERLHRILTAVLEERARQDAKWGEQNHPTVPAGFDPVHCLLPSARRAREQCADPAQVTVVNAPPSWRNSGGAGW